MDIPRSITLLVLIVASAFFAASETAFSYCNNVRIRLMSEDGNKSASRVVWILDRFERLVVTLLIAINILHVIAAAVATVIAVEILGSAGSAVATVVLTVLIFLFSENIPKNFARVNADSFCLSVSLVICFFMYILWPFAGFFMWIGNIVKKIMNIKQTEPSITEDEFTEIVEGVEDEGLIEPEETEIIKSAIEFGGLKVSEVMTHRESISAIPLGISIDELKKILIDEKYSRFPVYERNIDNIVGVLQATSCLWKIVKDVPFKLKNEMGKPYFVSPDTLTEEVFKGMGRRRTHFAVVRQNGKTLGIVTMEDILEEIVGEIYDEDDETPPPVNEGGEAKA